MRFKYKVKYKDIMIIFFKILIETLNKINNFPTSLKNKMINFRKTQI
jgi:hypothetical protein